jgi:hypothetical protein
VVGLGGEEGVGRVEIGGVLQRVVGAVGDCDGCGDEGCDANSHRSWREASELSGAWKAASGNGTLSFMDYDYDDSWLKSSHSYVYLDTPNSNLLCCICRSVPSSHFQLAPPLSHYLASECPS